MDLLIGNSILVYPESTSKQNKQKEVQFVIEFIYNVLKH